MSKGKGFRTKRHRRQDKQRDKFGSKAKPKHSRVGGRTGNKKAHQLQNFHRGKGVKMKEREAITNSIVSENPPPQSATSFSVKKE